MIKRLFFVLCMLSALAGCKTTDIKSIDALEQVLNEQEVRVIKTDYIIQDTKIKLLFPDTLQAIIKNESKDKIRNVVVSFAAWDENNEPVKLRRSIDLSEGAYVRDVTLNNIDLASGTTYEEKDGFGLNERCHVQKFKAIVKSYETVDGTTWENPQYDNWMNMYSGVNYNSLSVSD